MEKKRKSLFTVTTFSLLALMVLVTLSGMVVFKMQFDARNSIQSEEEYVEYDKYYAMITDNDRSDFWQAVYNGARQEGIAENAYVEFFAGNVGTRYTAEERMEIAIAAGVDGIIVEGNDSHALRDVIGKAKENGILVVVISQDVTESERISFVGIGRYDLGQTYGRQTCDLAREIIAQRESEEGADGRLKIMVLISQETDSNGSACVRNQGGNSKGFRPGK